MVWWKQNRFHSNHFIQLLHRIVPNRCCPDECWQLCRYGMIRTIYIFEYTRKVIRCFLYGFAWSLTLFVDVIHLHNEGIFRQLCAMRLMIWWCLLVHRSVLLLNCAHQIFIRIFCLTQFEREHVAPDTNLVRNGRVKPTWYSAIRFVWIGDHAFNFIFEMI